MKALLFLNVHLFKNTLMRTLKNPKQIIPALFLLFFFTFPLATFYALDIPEMPSPYTTQTAKPIIFSFLTMITWITIFHSTTKNTLVFSLPEIDFLFPSPVRRKTILLNHLLGSFIKLILQYLGMAALVLFIFSSIYHFSFLPRVFFLGTALSTAMIFASNLGNLVSLVSSHLPELNQRRNRRILLMVGVLFLGLILGYIFSLLLQGTPPVQAVTKTLNSSVVRIFMYPMAAASDVAVAWKITLNIVLKIFLLLFLCLVTTWGILSVETHFYEASEATSRELWESVQKIRRQEVLVSESFVKRIHTVKPFGKGSTALIWKNLVGTLRDVRMLLSTFFMIIFLFFLMFIREAEFFSALFFLFFLVFITSSYARWDFREDLRRIEIIKLIPDSNFKIVLSEVAVPSLFCTLFSYLFLIISYVIFPSTESKALLTGFSVVALPLFSVIMVTILNFSALYYPPQTENQIIPGILSMIFMIIVLGPSLLVLVLSILLHMLYVGLVIIVLLNIGMTALLLKLLSRKYQIFDLTSD